MKKVKSKGYIIEIDGGNRLYLEEGKICPSYAVLTNEKAWCDQANVVHLGEPPKGKL